MTDVRIYHNPRCSKSRETLALLHQQGIEPVISEYLKDAPTATELTELLGKLALNARGLMRSGESIYKELNLENPALSEDELIQAMTEHPILIERPIVVVGTQARIGRPPHTVLEII